MYHVNDKTSAVKEVQKFLLAITQKETYLPHITVDGFYGDDTRAAVLSFQKEKGLSETGSTDKETFDLLFTEYMLLTEGKANEKNIISLEVFPLKRGSAGSDVSALNSNIRELSLYYRDLGEPYSDYFSDTTENAVKLLQEYFDEEITGIVTVALFDRIKNETKYRKNFPKPK